LYGASAVVLYNTLAAQYRLNQTDHGDHGGTPSYDDILWPQEYVDYDCSRGTADIPSDALSFDPLPYNSDQNDPLLSGNTDENLCLLHSADRLRGCPSYKCLVAHPPSTSDPSRGTDGDTIRVCCAWDMLIEPVGDRDMINITKKDRIDIPTVFMGMRDGDDLVGLVRTRSATSAVLRSRYKPYYNPSSMLIWWLGVLVAAAASYRSAAEYHRGIRKYLARRSAQRQRQRPGQGHPRQSSSSSSSMTRSSPLQEETLQLEIVHSLMFVVMASASLLILFFFKVNYFDHHNVHT
jgi:hypothetical protein